MFPAWGRSGGDNRVAAWSTEINDDSVFIDVRHGEHTRAIEVLRLWAHNALQDLIEDMAATPNGWATNDTADQASKRQKVDDSRALTLSLAEAIVDNGKAANPDIPYENSGSNLLVLQRALPDDEDMSEAKFTVTRIQGGPANWAFMQQPNATFKQFTDVRELRDALHSEVLSHNGATGPSAMHNASAGVELLSSANAVRRWVLDGIATIQIHKIQQAIETATNAGEALANFQAYPTEYTVMQHGMSKQSLKEELVTTARNAVAAVIAPWKPSHQDNGARPIDPETGSNLVSDTVWRIHIAQNEVRWYAVGERPQESTAFGFERQNTPQPVSLDFFKGFSETGMMPLDLFIKYGYTVPWFKCPEPFERYRQEPTFHTIRFENINGAQKHTNKIVKMDGGGVKYTCQSGRPLVYKARKDGPQYISFFYKDDDGVNEYTKEYNKAELKDGLVDRAQWVNEIGMGDEYDGSEPLDYYVLTTEYAGFNGDSAESAKQYAIIEILFTNSNVWVPVLPLTKKPLNDLDNILNYCQKIRMQPLSSYKLYRGYWEVGKDKLNYISEFDPSPESLAVSQFSNGLYGDAAEIAQTDTWPYTNKKMQHAILQRNLFIDNVDDIEQTFLKKVKIELEKKAQIAVDEMYELLPLTINDNYNELKQYECMTEDPIVFSSAGDDTEDGSWSLGGTPFHVVDSMELALALVTHYAAPPLDINIYEGNPEIDI